MADLLLPTLPSDDENDQDDAVVEGEDDEDDDSMCMDESFTLHQGTYVNDIVAQTTSNGGITGWSFQNALNQHQLDNNNYNDSDRNPTQPLRMDIDAIIAAKRKDIIQKANNQGDVHTTSDKRKGNIDTTNNENKMNRNDDNADEDSSGDSNDEDDDDNSDDDSDEEDEGDDDDEDMPHIVDDENLQQEDDVLTTRLTKTQKKQEKSNQQQLISNQTIENKEEDENEEDESEDDDDDDDDEDYEAKREASKADAFYDTETSIAVSQKQNSSKNNSTTGFDNANTIQVFNQLPLCRPLLRGIAAMGFVQPTPIQSAVIPLVLHGRDICASAVTGSGKTAAFVVPIAERIIHRSSSNGAYCCTRALILTPTRELAAQCYGMMSTFIQYTKLRASLIVGGSKNNTSQATELRTRPDFIVATPGRLLDHVTNSTGFTLADIEFLILDEADRLLDLGFSDEIMEIVKSCPIQRQTLLFSATMNTKVDDLIRLSLKNPVRVKISDQSSADNDTTNSNGLEVAPRLEQEFIRIRASNEGLNREGILLALLTRTYKSQVICFFDTKVTAHRMMILAGLCGIRCAELHGNLTQPQRLTALEDFRSGNVDVLLATDLAARGLDINRVQTVINFEMPTQLATYIHRIGRTARAGRGGRSCTLIGEGRRHLMKELLKDSSNKKKSVDNSSAANPVSTTGAILSRTVPSAVIAHFAAKVQSLEVHYEEVLQAETVAKLDRIAEMEVTRAQNLIEHADEIKQRPPKEWFVSNTEKQRAVLNNTKETKGSNRTVDNPTSGMHRMTRKKRRAREVREAMEQGDDTNNGDGDNDQSHPKSVNDLKIKSDVRKQKRLQAEMKHEKSGLSIHDVDMQEEKKLLKKAKKKKSCTNTNDAIGDSNLFGEERVSFAASGSKPKRKNGESEFEDKPARSSYKFVGYNPDKKLGRKKSHNAFKSKSKHKRR